MGRDRKGVPSEWKFIERAYSKGFCSELARRFDFDAFRDDNVHELRRIGAVYRRTRRIDDGIETAKSIRREYKNLLAATDRFLRELRSLGADWLAHDMFRSAVSLREPRPQTHFPALTEHELQRGEPYYLELLRLLKLVRLAASREVDRQKLVGGRPKNIALTALVRSAADFWVVQLGRHFSIDHHKGVGMTDAFDFVRALANPLDDVSDKQIITAMRAEIKVRRAEGIPTRPLGEADSLRSAESSLKELRRSLTKTSR